MEDYDEGFARNVQRLFGPGGTYNGMGNKPLYSVTLDDAKDTLSFNFQDGTRARFQVEGDCCSHSWIEELTVPESVNGLTLIEVQDYRQDQQWLEPEEYTLRQSYKTVFRLSNGETITLEYRNDSNGYYGGYLVRINDAGERDYGDEG